MNLDLLRGKKVVLRCTTEQEAINFIKYIDELRGSKSPNISWYHGEFTCYKLNENYTWDYCDIRYCDVRFYKLRGFKILTFKDIMENV